MDLGLIGAIGMLLMVLFLFSGIGVAFAMLLLGLAGFGYIVSMESALKLVAKDFFAMFSSYSLSCIPMFVLMGQIAFNSQISARLYEATYKVFGRVRGSLAMATIAACAGMAAGCGSSPATAATMGAVTLPEMRKYNYGDALATGSVAAGGTLGILIPPSVVLIIYGIMTEQSIAKLFFAGILPGTLLTGLFIATIYVMTRVNPGLGPPGPKTTLKEKAIAVISGTGETVAVFALIMGGLFIGLFTPTEAGAAGAAGMLIVSLVRRKLSWQGFVAAVIETVRTSAMIFLIAAGATVMGHFLAVTRIPYATASWASGLALPAPLVMVLIMVIYVLGGCFVDALALILLTIPILFPVSVALGFDPIWFGIVVVIVTEIALITPPVGINVYIIAGVARDVPMSTVFRGIFPFLVPLFLLIVVLMVFPEIALFLPRLLG